MSNTVLLLVCFMCFFGLAAAVIALIGRSKSAPNTKVPEDETTRRKRQFHAILNNPALQAPKESWD